MKNLWKKLTGKKQEERLSFAEQSFLDIARQNGFRVDEKNSDLVVTATDNYEEGIVLDKSEDRFYAIGVSPQKGDALDLTFEERKALRGVTGIYDSLTGEDVRKIADKYGIDVGSSGTSLRSNRGNTCYAFTTECTGKVENLISAYRELVNLSRERVDLLKGGSE